MTDTPAHEARQRVRVWYAKGESIKFISHHDEFRLWERALRRADLPLLYKQGFNPQPHLQFAAPLGVGITGRHEPLDIVLSPPLPVAEIAERLRAKVPPGILVQSVEEIPPTGDALQPWIVGADYTILLHTAPGELEDDLLAERIAGFLKQTTIWRERERKGSRYTYNLRPLVLELTALGYDAVHEEHPIFLRVQMRNGATGRPDEVVDALGFDDFARTLRRERIYFANQPADAALMAQYPVVQQKELAAPPGVRGVSLRGREPGLPIQDRARTLSERAGDEFG